MSKKTVHIISHSHWDREWYLPFEEHHLRLVDLIDQVLDLFDTDPDYRYFHLDGQTITLDDYLQIRPHQEARLKAAVQSGKLRIGPFYILQDAFLISGEATVRNGLIGYQDLKRWGVKGEQLGYYPDTFGLTGQTPQITRGMGMSVAAFGRGVKPTGFDNQTFEEGSFKSAFSELTWKSPDGSDVLGILFANWYSNGNEIPAEPEQAKVFWDKKLADAERYAVSDQLLMLNGCDHQPAQTDLSQAIALANQLYPDYEFIHSNFTLYQEALEASLASNQPQLSVVEGELRSQATDGWYTLANTASSRLYLKQYSARLSDYLEQVLEPLATLATRYGYVYPSDKIDFIWKTLLQNYPHDSICGCSIDEVHRGMVSRFEAVEAASQTLVRGILDFLAQQVKAPNRLPDQPYVLQVWNPSNCLKEGRLVSKVVLDRAFFSQYPVKEAYKRMAELAIEDYQLVDGQGQVVPATIVDLGANFDYDLPDDRFRRAYFARELEVEWLATVPAMSLAEYYLVPKTEDLELEGGAQDKEFIENDYLKVALAANGSVTITDKVTGQVYEDQGLLEETGDVGNEYIFRESLGQRLTQADALISTRVIHDGLADHLVLGYQLQVPISADYALLEAQRQVIDVVERQIGRADETVPVEIFVTYSLTPQSRGLAIRLEGHNEVLDHRVRLGFKLPERTDRHFVDSAYEWLWRSNHVAPEWRNPSNPQALHRNVAIGESQGLTLSVQGLPEYEVTVDDQATYLYLTCLRCTGELGDWGYFPTPEAQCLGDYEASAYLQFWQGQEQLSQSFATGSSIFIPLLVKQASLGQDLADWQASPVKVNDLPRGIEVTAFKQAHDSQDWILRLVSHASETLDLAPYLPSKLQSVNLLEEDLEETSSLIAPYEIKTYRLKKG